MHQDLATYLLVAAIALAAGAALAYAALKMRIERTRSELVEARTQLAERTASYKREQEILEKNSITVLMHPYKQEHGENGYFSDERRAEIGYQYQLFVAGVPCFEPHRVAVEVLSKKEVNVERIEKATQTAFSLIETFASKHPAFTAVKSAHLVAERLNKLTEKRG